jgi:DNA repair protein RecN (Recombination protein N)
MTFPIFVLQNNTPQAMIKKLYVADYALIDTLSLTPTSSMNIITGETGAGKSIIMGALSLVMGERADTSVLRNDNKKCVIEATIDISNYNLEEFFKENDIDYENPTIIRREIAPTGRSRAFINDSPVLLETLSALSARLIDVHSQHQSLSLSRHQYRTHILDSYCGNDVLMTLYRTALSDYKKAARLLDELIEKNDRLSSNEELNRYLLQELENAALYIGMEEEIEETIERLSNAQKIKESLWTADELLNGEVKGVIENIRLLKGEIAAISRFLPAESDVDARMENILIELKDISSEISSLMEEVDEDPASLSRYEDRLSTLHSLYRKHNVKTVDELLGIQHRLKEEVATLTDMENEINEARVEAEKALAVLKEASDNLYEARVIGSRELSAEIESIIKDLGMKDARYVIDVTHGNRYEADGCDEISFLFTANAGTAPTPLEKTASGGELSRVMMAIKCSLASKSHLPTLVLDEIDTGISGEVAMKMGRLMEKMSRNMQLIVITHLPQIASRADLHLKVYKETSDDVSHTRIRHLTDDERVTEIAQMISGSDIQESALTHARELLKKN